MSRTTLSGYPAPPVHGVSAVPRAVDAMMARSMRHPGVKTPSASDRQSDRFRDPILGVERVRSRPIISPSLRGRNEDVLSEVQLGSYRIHQPPGAVARSAEPPKGTISAQLIIEAASVSGSAGRGLVKCSLSMISAARGSGTLQISS